MRCVNIDWLEVYCLESPTNFPCDADYYRRKGYFVKERDYGTRQYDQMFTVLDDHGRPFVEIRRKPCSGKSSFSGLNEYSTHLRLVNRYCYFSNAVSLLRDFLAAHDYQFKRIFRIDICCDFIRFDYGDMPDKFIKRYLQGRYSKINQCKLAAHGNDGWSNFDWESLSWGANKSMVSTKLYCKTKELNVPGHDKPYIRRVWYDCGLVQNPLKATEVNKDGSQYEVDVWRLEYSMKSLADRWLIIEDNGGKHEARRAVPHRLDMFDTPEKILQRFEDLTVHYFRFKKYEEGKRKNLCEDKKLFNFNNDRTFAKITQLPEESQPYRSDMILRNRLLAFKGIQRDIKVRNACDVILRVIDSEEVRRIARPMDMRDFDRLLQMILGEGVMEEKEAVEVVDKFKTFNEACIPF